MATVIYQINCGGSAISPYAADQYYSSGTTYNHGGTANTSGVTNPAPVGVYTTERYGNNTYTFPSLVVGAHYLVRLHFCECYHNGSGLRVFDVSINGTQVLNDYDIYAEVGNRVAVCHEYYATANVSGQIVIVFTTVVDNATIQGIEIYTADMNIWVNNAGTFKQTTDAYINVSGTFKRVSNAYVNVSGTWKELF